PGRVTPHPAGHPGRSLQTEVHRPLQRRGNRLRACPRRPRHGARPPRRRAALPGARHVLLGGHQRRVRGIERLRDDLPLALREPEPALVEDPVRLGPPLARVLLVAHRILSPRGEPTPPRLGADLHRRVPALRAQSSASHGALFRLAATWWPYSCAITASADSDEPGSSPGA